jgi:hypothetical protein
MQAELSVNKQCNRNTAANSFGLDIIKKAVDISSFVFSNKQLDQTLLLTTLRFLCCRFHCGIYSRAKRRMPRAVTFSPLSSVHVAEIFSFLAIHTV